MFDAEAERQQPEGQHRGRDHHQRRLERHHAAGDEPRDAHDDYRERLYATVAETVARYAPAAPVVLGLDWGHTTPTAPLPLGARVEVDPATETVRVP